MNSTYPFSSRNQLALLFLVVFYFPSYATADVPPTVLTFDDMFTGDSVIPMPSGYGGISWPNNVGVWGFSQNGYYDPYSPPNRVLFNRNSETGLVETIVTFIEGPKIFDGAYFSGFTSFQFKLYRGGALVGTSNVLTLPASGQQRPVFLSSGYAAPVDAVGVLCSREFSAMDDFTFKAVPEPSTLFLLAIGAISLIGRRRIASR